MMTRKQKNKLRSEKRMLQCREGFNLWGITIIRALDLVIRLIDFIHDMWF